MEKSEIDEIKKFLDVVLNFTEHQRSKVAKREVVLGMISIEEMILNSEDPHPWKQPTNENTHQYVSKVKHLRENGLMLLSELDLDDDILFLLTGFAKNNYKIQCVKYVRIHTGLSFQCAKAYVDENYVKWQNS